MREEPENVARSVELMRPQIRGAHFGESRRLERRRRGHYAAAVRAIKTPNAGTAVEALTPDFQGVMRDVRTVLDSGLDVFAQNVETVGA